MVATGPITPPLFYSKYKKQVDANTRSGWICQQELCLAGVGCINTRAGHEPSRSLKFHNHSEGPHKGLDSMDF